MQSSASPGLKILLVDDQNSTRLVIGAELIRAGHRVIEADCPSAALALFAQHKPDLVLLDVEMPEHNGYWTARALRDSEPSHWTPIIFLSALANEYDIWLGIEAGGDDYLVKPVSPMILHAKLRAMQRLANMRTRLVELSDELRAANTQLHALSQVDALTGLLNRRALDERLQRELQIAQREGKPLTLLLCDVDHFKRYNDSLGHVQGDGCLKRVGQLLHQTCRRPADCAARYGGEEFALVLPNTPRAGALTYARALVRTIAGCALPHPDSPVASHVTVSGGITTCVPDDATTAEGLLVRADEALYTAKQHGRNRFFSYEMQVDTAELRH